MSHGSIDHKEIEIEKFITHSSWEKYLVHLRGPHREVKARCKQSEQDLGHMHVLGFTSSVLWGSQARVGLVNLNQRAGFG